MANKCDSLWKQKHYAKLCTSNNEFMWECECECACGEVYGKKRKLMECTYTRLFAIEIGQQQERPKQQQQQQQAECVNNILIGFEIGIKPWIRECVIKSRFTHSIICFCFGEKEKNNKQN